MNSADRATVAATFAALLAVAGQVAGKAARDALFLSSFSITDLPSVVIASSVVSVFVVVFTSRLFTAFGPATVVPAAFVISAVLLLVEWSMIERIPRVIAIAAYLHFAVFGLVLISGIWSVVNERFDPRTAKERVGRIALGATLGGMLGGVLAERVAAMSSLASLLPILSFVSLAGAGLVILIGRDPDRVRSKPVENDASRNGFEVLRGNRYLREIAVLLLVVTVAAGFLDYVFKAEASAAFEDREALMRFFAGFYTVLGLATFLVQSLLANPVLRRFGIARTVSVLPAAVALGAAGLVAVPGLATATLARGGESALRSSLFRTGYELLYTPVSEADRRAAKTIIDAGFDRLGDALAGGLITLLLLVLPASGTPVLVIGAGICGVMAVLLAMDLHRGYVASLEDRLLEQAEDVQIEPTDDVLRTSAVMQTYATLDLRQFVQSRRPPIPPSEPNLPAAASPPRDPVVARLLELRSGDSDRALKAILDPRRLERPHAAAMVELLARDDLSATVVSVLRASMPRFAGLLLDALLDPDSEFAIRRRVPRILGSVSESWVAGGLLEGLTDRRFEVRYQCGRALARIHHSESEVEFDRQTVCDLVLREVAVDQRVWESYRLLDSQTLSEDDSEKAYQWLDEYLADRTGRGLEHVFTLLALVYPTEPLRIAFRGLHTDDSRLRGTALEYLESILPEKVRQRLWPFIDHRKEDRLNTLGSRDAVLEELLRSNSAIEASIAGLPRKP